MVSIEVTYTPDHGTNSNCGYRSFEIAKKRVSFAEVDSEANLIS